MENSYGTGTYRNTTFKMSLTEALRAHVNHEINDAVKHYNSAIGGARTGHAYLLCPLLFLQSQAATWPFANAIKHAYKAGYSQELSDISQLIEDPAVRDVYKQYLLAVQENRSVTRRIPRSAFVDPTPTGRIQR